MSLLKDVHHSIAEFAAYNFSEVQYDECRTHFRNMDDKLRVNNSALRRVCRAAAPSLLRKSIFKKQDFWSHNDIRCFT
jgi:hypothetical protein